MAGVAQIFNAIFPLAANFPATQLRIIDSFIRLQYFYNVFFVVTPSIFHIRYYPVIGAKQTKISSLLVVQMVRFAYGIYDVQPMHYLN